MYLTKREKRKRNVILGKILVNKLMDYEVLIFREPKDIRKIRKQNLKFSCSSLQKKNC